MAAFKQAQRQRTQQDDEQIEEQPERQDQEQLDDDVACCLADIDETLAGHETEEQRALREYHELRESGVEEHDDKLRVWQAQYAHLGFRREASCCGSYYVDKDGKFI